MPPWGPPNPPKGSRGVTTYKPNSNLADMSLDDFAAWAKKNGLFQYRTTSRTGTGGGGGGDGVSAKAKFDYDKQQDMLNRAFQQRQFDYSQEQDAFNRAFQQQQFGFTQRQYEDDLAKQARSLAAMQQFYSGGGARTGMDSLIAAIGEQSKGSEGAVRDAYGRAVGGINEGYDTAERLTGAGYGALEAFLRANPNNPYANVQVSAGAAPDAMEQLLSAYGVSAEPVRAQVAAEQQAAQQGAAGFQNLLNVLGASAQQSDASRLAEMMMAQNLARETLGTQRATFRSQAEQAQANALAEIQARLAQARIEQEAAASSRAFELASAIAAAGGAVPNVGSPTPTSTATPTATPTAVPPTAVSGESSDMMYRFTPQEAALAAAGMNDITTKTIINQGMGNPLVPGGIPDYMRVIQDQLAAEAARKQEDDRRRREELARLAAAQQLAMPTLGMFGME